MLKLNKLAVFAFALLPIALPAQTPAPPANQTQTVSDHRADKTAIEQVMNQYHAAILAHDGNALAGLFLPEANLWLNVLTDSAYVRVQANSPSAQKVRMSNYKDFAKLVSTTPKSFDPEHNNVAIHTDGTIAAVYFDFCFQRRREGQQSWQRDLAAGQNHRWLAHCVHRLLVRAACAAIARANARYVPRKSGRSINLQNPKTEGVA